ncbi:hypothetical protein PVT25_05950 [Paenarthrobacter ureafaciens]|jgi:hypothetical protein|uniref:hypothetical protein n=1 Tax=Paenarthrobacter ureafaciens TaxID=37931 RepID=UPI0008A69EDA|nr:hypothetical protein [Paenarthrobacter ureafaciens]AOY74294.1 hypothetical protein ARZXY2_4795 [Arthrobacter sp. ZXY-2]MCX8455057.1 hypothetical protein [Paenarthrobacter ureafaciens]MCY0974473.1 hypothetical protein [Paenarthrobacter ureafaciens]WNZ05076.1 hypothetical protein PVT25_05950 [Paenarthrobacter ureafaciens]
MAFHLQPKWQPLIGQLVIVKLQDEEIRRGVVDAVTDDDQILWLDSDGAEPRRLFHRADGFNVWIDYKWETNRFSRCPDFQRAPAS